MLQASLISEAKKLKYNLEASTPAIKARNKEVVSKTFHKAGIVVPVDMNEVGYRPLTVTDGEWLLDTNWSGAWKKSLSDFWLTTGFSFQIALYLHVRQKENLTLHQVSLRTLFLAPLQLKDWEGKGIKVAPYSFLIACALNLCMRTWKPRFLLMRGSGMS